MSKLFHVCCAALAIEFLISGSNSAAPVEFTGVVKIVDGDTVAIENTKIRLLGIDAPEMDQLCIDEGSKWWTCGISARDALIDHTAGAAWTCRGSGKDRFGRLLADCAVNGENIGAWMVRNGWVMSFVRYSHMYDQEEADARSAKIGLWSGAFIAPWEWRNRTGGTTVLGAVAVPVDAQKSLLSPRSSEEAPSPDCIIKGNVNRRGFCIYHLPGSHFYEQVNMKVNGKRWFCSTADAEAAGCRSTKN